MPIFKAKEKPFNRRLIQADLVVEHVEPSPFYSNQPAVKKVFSEYMDMAHTPTRKAILTMNEADHNQLITKITSNLYDHIIKRTTDIDYGEIPNSMGDVTKLKNYDDLKDCIALIHDLLKEYRQDTDCTDIISEALANIETRKQLFDRAFRYNCELPCMMYNTVVLGIYGGLSYLIAGCIEFIKTPKDETFKIALDKVAYAKVKDYTLYDSLDKFNKSCKSGDFDKAMEVVIDKKLKKFTGITIGLMAGGVAVGILVILGIVPILRELTYIFYHTRVKMTDFLDTQADLIQMNAYNVEHSNSVDPEEREAIVERQMAIANDFRALSNKLNIDGKRSDVEASRELENATKKFKLDDLEEEIDISPETAEGSGSVLF